MTGGAAQDAERPLEALAMAAGGLDGAGTSAGTANAWAPDADLPASAWQQGREGQRGAPGGPQTGLAS